jgi:hypothetical protein
MAGFGAVLCLLTANLDGGFIPFCAGFGGGILSLVAAIWLTKPPARQYFARPSSGVTLAKPASRPSDGASARFWRLVPELPVRHPRQQLIAELFLRAITRRAARPRRGHVPADRLAVQP